MLNPQLLASRDGAFHVAEANFWPQTRATLSFPTKMRILDSTLRKTYFTAGHTTSVAGFVRIAEALVDLGVTDTCLNVTWAGDTEPTPQDWDLMTAVLGADLPLTVNVWSDVLLGNGRDSLPIDPIDGLRRLVDAGVRCAAPGIVPAPDADSARRQMDDLDAYFDEAAHLGVTTTITLAQVGLRDFDELVRVSRRAVQRGAARLDLMDSTSSMSPEAMRQFVRRYRAALPDGAQVTMHVHDEFGLATAGALAAASEGAAPDVSMNGMSYRSGFAPLEEVVLALEVLYGVDTGLHLDEIARVSRVVARESGLPVPQLKPLTGSYAHLKHMPGDVTQVLTKGDDAFPPISHGLVPAQMGSAVEWVWGGSSSLAQVHALALANSIELTGDEARAVRSSLDAAVADVQGYPRWLRPVDATALLRRRVAEIRTGATMPAAREVVTDAVHDAMVADAIVERLADSPYGEIIRPVGEHVAAVIDELSTGRLIDILGGFNRFGEQAGLRAEHSAAEERALERSDRSARSELAALAIAYERRFGFRAVVVADGRTAEQLVAELRAAITRDGADELKRARGCAAAILSARIIRLAGMTEEER